MADKKKPFYIKKEILIDMVRRLQTKEPGAEMEIYEAFHNKIYGHLIIRTKDSEIADELINDVFMEIFNTVHNLREPAAFVSWCNIIVEHRVSEYFREYRRRIAKEEKVAEEMRLAAKIHAEEIAVSELLHLLPQKQARVLQLHVLDKYLIKDIAIMENIPVGTVKSRLFYGRKALKELIAQQKD